MAAVEVSPHYSPGVIVWKQSRAEACHGCGDKKCVNKIRARALNRHEFRQFPLDMEEYGDLILHCEVRWLSKGKVLSRFGELKNRVLEFLTEIDEFPAEHGFLADGDWQNDLAFLVDITAHLNALNVQLQGSHEFFTNMCNYVASFQVS